MRSVLIFTFLCALSFNSFAQFEKHEKLIGGTFDFAWVKDKNSMGGGNPFGNTSPKETDFSISPEFGYTVSRNLVVSVFGNILSYKYENAQGDVQKNKGYAIGGAITKYKFFTKGFGMLFRLNGSYSPSWWRNYQANGVVSPKNKYYLTEFNLEAGLVYRFSKHFSAQTTFGHITYDHLVSTQEDVIGNNKRDQVWAGFYRDVRLTVHYVFKKLGK